MSEDIEYLQRLAISHLATRILMSGIQIGVFETIDDEGKTASEIAQETGSSVRGIRVLLDCLVSFHLLTKSNQRYYLAPISSRYLRKHSTEYMGHLWEDESSLEQWNHLNDAIRSGKPLRKKGAPAEEAASFAGLARSLHVVHWQAAEKAAEILVARDSHPGMRVLDVACGSGVWGISIAKADPQSRIVAHDLPEILEITKDHVRRNYVEEQFSYLPGDLGVLDFGEDRFDLAILGNIIHFLGEQSSRVLLKRVYRSLKGSGRIAIIDIIPHEDRTGPQSTLIMALAMLVDTEEGDLFTLSEYGQWLEESGFVKIEIAEIGSHSPMIIAHKG
jgi:ubiquinone/menaquinone biosynthesis C-methylase UbiE